MFATEHRVARLGQFLANNTRRTHVAGNNLLGLFPANRGVDGLGSTLGHVAYTVELGALTTVPHGTEFRKFVRNHRIGATHTRKARRLTEAAELDGAGAGTRNLENGMRQRFVLDIAVVGSVEQDYGTVLVGVVHELLEGLPAEHRTRGVVGAAQVDHLHRILGQIRLEIVLGG